MTLSNFRIAPQQLPKNKLKNASMTVIVDLDRRIDSQLDRNAPNFAAGVFDFEGQRLAGPEGIGKPGNAVGLRSA